MAGLDALLPGTCLRCKSKGRQRSCAIASSCDDPGEAAIEFPGQNILDFAFLKQKMHKGIYYWSILVLWPKARGF